MTKARPCLSDIICRKHTVTTVYELGWSEMKNGDLLAFAEGPFDIFITTDQQLRYQQNLAGRKLAILVLLTTSWPRIKRSLTEIQEAVDRITPGEYLGQL